MYSVAVGSLGYAYLLANEPNRALSAVKEAAIEDNLRASFWPTYPLIILADVFRAVGKDSEAAETATRALEISNKRGERGFEAWAMRVMASVKNAAQRPEEAKNWYQRALKQASDLSMRPLVAHCHLGLADVHRHLGNEKQARLEKVSADEMYHSMGMTYWQSGH